MLDYPSTGRVGDPKEERVRSFGDAIVGRGRIRRLLGREDKVFCFFF